MGTNINCGDCNTKDPQWASLNRGLLLCKDCAYIHRSLGPDFSRIKSLNNSVWNGNLRKMIMVLVQGPANNVWEHTLLDPSSKIDYQTKKPGPNDSSEIKRKFIILKHFQFQFVLRQRPETFEERNRELHSTVRTSDLGTTLRLIASGADPNYFHHEKGTCAMHVAARTGQSLQIELLFQHGAKTDSQDYLGQTPVEHAMSASFKELANRILELRYLLTDKMTSFVGDGVELPDHSTSKHIVIPKQKFVSNPIKENAIRKFQSNVVEQLAIDIYDEIDRREIEKDLIKTNDHSKYSIAFLPVNPNYPQTRNQTRQKFARLTNDELSSLIVLVLIDCKRRHKHGTSEFNDDNDIFSQPENKVEQVSSTTSKILTDDEYPLYDSVANDDDIILEEKTPVAVAQQPKPIEETNSVSSSNVKIDPSCDLNKKHESTTILELKLKESEGKIQELEDSNQNLKLEIKILEKMVDTLIHENIKLRTNGITQQQQKQENFSLKTSLSTPKLVNGNGSSGSNSSREVSPSTSVSLYPSILNRVNNSSIRSASLFESRTFNKRQDDGLPLRPNTTELYLRMSPQHSRCELIQDTVKKIVEMIKVLVEFANSCDFQGMVLTTNKIFETANEMASTLLLLEPEKELIDKARDLLYQVIHMQSEVRIISDQAEKYGIFENEDQTERMIRKVKLICFEVGSTMKKLVNYVTTTNTP